MSSKDMTKDKVKKSKIQRVSTGNAKIDNDTSFWERFKAKYLNLFFAKKLLWSLFRLVLLVGISYVIVYPYFSKITTSLMAQEDFVDTTVLMIPRNWTLDTYEAIINENKYFTALFNTSLLSLLCGVSQTLICAIIGYGFAKFNFKFKGVLFLLVIFTMVVPHETLRQALLMRFVYFDLIGIVPQINTWMFTMFENGTIGEETYKAIGEVIGKVPNLIGTYWPMAILSLTGLAFKNGLYIFMMRQYYKGVPDELEEAAYVDGAGVIKTFVRIILPMSTAMLVTIFMFSFSWQWTDTFYTGLFLGGDQVWLLPKIVSIPTSLVNPDFAGQTAFETAIRNGCGILILIPLIILYLFGQRTLIEGVERSGITG